jgi:hypothetical protein
MFRWLILPRYGAEAYGETIPGVDRGDCQGQVSQFLFAKVLAYLLKNLVGNVID